MKKETRGIKQKISFQGWEYLDSTRKIMDQITPIIEKHLLDVASECFDGSLKSAEMYASFDISVPWRDRDDTAEKNAKIPEDFDPLDILITFTEEGLDTTDEAVEAHGIGELEFVVDLRFGFECLYETDRSNKHRNAQVMALVDELRRQADRLEPLYDGSGRTSPDEEPK